MKYDIILDNTTKPFSSAVIQSHNQEKKFCPLCSNVGVESVVNDEDVCEICGDIGIKHGITKDDELFVVNSVGGAGGPSSSSNLSFGTFGGLDKKKTPHTNSTIQDALKETEMKT